MVRACISAAFQLGGFFLRHESIAFAGDADVLDGDVLAVDHHGAQPLQVAVFVGLCLRVCQP
jgi:hypothetical protein